MAGSLTGAGAASLRSGSSRLAIAASQAPQQRQPRAHKAESVAQAAELPRQKWVRLEGRPGLLAGPDASAGTLRKMARASGYKDTRIRPVG
jgi:hypothetical protein